MCTQKRIAENKERRSVHGDRHGGICLARKSVCGSRTTRNSNASSKLDSRYLKSTSWRNVPMCNNPSSNFNGRCLLAEQSIQCRHIICLLFACLAMSASAQNSTSGYDAFSSPRPDATQSEQWPVHDDQNASIPLSESQGSTEGSVAPTVTLQITSGMFTEDEVDNENNSKVSTDNVKNAESQPTEKNEHDVDEQSVYFILRVFHRYSGRDYLLKADLEKLLAKIGFIPALINSEIGLAHSNNDGVDQLHDDNDNHVDYSYDHYDNHVDRSHDHNDALVDQSQDHHDDLVDHSHDHTGDNHSHDHHDDTHSHDLNDLVDHLHDHHDNRSHDHNDDLVDHSHDHHDALVDHSHDNNDALVGHSHDHNDDHVNHSHDHNDDHVEHSNDHNDTHHEQERPDKPSDHTFPDVTSMVNNDSVPATTSTSLPESSGRQSAQGDDVTTSATSRSRRRRRQLSPHQHDEHNQCLSTRELLQAFQFENLDKLNADHFWHLCPALIDQLDAGYCKKEPPTAGSQDLRPGATHSSDVHGHDHDHTNTHSHDHGHTNTHSHDHDNGDTSKTDMPEQPGAQPVTAAVWFYALVSVAVISLCSVAGVVVIPNMKRVFYNHILQFLVALAVGAMSGDALLHLFPHAMLSESHDAHHHNHPDGENNTDNAHKHDHHRDANSKMSSHMVGLYKGLVALMGIYSFFFLERLFTLFTRSRSGKSARKQKRRRGCSGGREQRSKACHMVNSKLETDGRNAPSCEEMVMIVHPNKALRAYADVSHEAYLHRCDESLVHPPAGQNVVAAAPGRDQVALRADCSTLEGFTNLGVAGWSGDQVPAAITDAEIIGIVKDTEPVATTHSHSHSHLAPDFVGPLSSVAMMIIVGDMIHNFCDGLAIGAAYAGSVAGGLSTSVAVFCHELPHEIGDFAVLVRSGLTLRKAVYFNLVSSVPCFIGAIIGLAVGNVSSTSSWIFAGVAGMFLYVTLVDLIPEMSSVYTKSGEPWFLHLLLQASGIAVGTTIMLVISVSEESLLTAFH